ncbi:hypothetical protein JHK87_024776 [Glycine soja]|nr:hypothetical protein JHK87_024776 [Glycine soja]
MMDKDTLGYSGRKGSKNLGELASGDYLTFGALIWRRSGGLTPTTNNFQVQEMSMEPHPLRAWRTKQTYRIATRGDPVENVVVAALQFEFLQSGALLNEARINDFLRETGLPSVYATIQTKQSSQRSCLFPTTIHFGDFTNRCPLSHLQNLVFLVIPLIAEKEDSQFTFQWNHGFRVQLYVVRVQPESELRLCVPSGLLL